MTNKIPSGLRLPQETLDLLRGIALKEKRSLNNLLEKIIEEYLLQNGYIDNQ